jgi:hypothetical protein
MTEEGPIYTAPEAEHILDVLTEGERAVLETYRALDEEQRYVAWVVLRALYAQRRQPEETTA